MSCARESTLIIGYGNVLRGDDGVGVCAATALREAGFRSMDRHQLTPELAEAVAGAQQVIFIDADIALPPGEVSVMPVAAGSGGALEHHATPASLLRLSQEVYGRAPSAVVIGIGGESHEFGRALSEPALDGVNKAVELCMNPVWWKS